MAEILPGMGRASVMAPDGSILNTCASDVLVEVLRYLKRAYWPFPWESGVGDRGAGEWAGGSGFMGAAQVRLPPTQSSARQLPLICWPEVRAMCGRPASCSNGSAYIAFAHVTHTQSSF